MKQDNHIDFTLLLKVQWKELYNVNNIIISIHKKNYLCYSLCIDLRDVFIFLSM